MFSYLFILHRPSRAAPAVCRNLTECTHVAFPRFVLTDSYFFFNLVNTHI